MTKYGLKFIYKEGKIEEKFYVSESVRDAAFRPWKKKLSTKLGRLSSWIKSVQKIQR